MQVRHPQGVKNSQTVIDSGYCYDEMADLNSFPAEETEQAYNTAE